MSNENENTNADVEQGPSELSMLKERADVMGIKYHPNIGLDKLKAKIEEVQNPPENPEVIKPDMGLTPDPYAAHRGEESATIAAAARVQGDNTLIPGKVQTPAQLQAKRRKDALRLVRIRVSNMNPLKGNMKGEILSVGNSELGMVKKFIPFNAEQGWHVPNILLEELRNRKFMSHYEVKIGNKKHKRHKLIPEYSIELMEPLTAKELDELKQRQIMASV
jgi:hypothetical protein